MNADAAAAPRPEDSDFCARFTVSDDILDDAFGPAGGSELPRITHRPSRSGNTEPAIPQGDLGYTEPSDR